MRFFAAAQAVATAALIPRLARGRRRAAPLAARSAAPGSVSVVIPARDEEARLRPCLDGLRADAGLLEVIVVDDQSSDGTAHVVSAGGARVVSGALLPDGWAGKPWALQQGLHAARGSTVVFLDADARPSPGLIGALAALAAPRTVVSCAPRFACAGLLDTALHASFAATLVYRFGPTDVDGWQPPPDRALLNGQCVCALRSDLVEAGGWEPVRGHTTEDIALARSLRGRGWHVVFRDGTDLLTVEMYASARETWSGWSRSLLGPDIETPLRHAVDLGVLWLCWALPLPRVLLKLLFRRRAAPLDLALAAVRLALVKALRRSYPSGTVGFWASPLLDVPAAARLTWSVLRPDRTWRGRTYARGTAGR